MGLALLGSASAAPLRLSPPPRGYVGEARRLTGRFMGAFWDAKAGMFRAPVRSAETVDSDPAHNNGYVLWPSLLGLHALIEGERVFPGRYKARIAEVARGLEGYYDREKRAYNAWLHFPGNDDKYFDDNGWVVTTLVEAYEVTKSRAHLVRAREVMEGFVRGGWDATGKPGGVRWGTDPRNVNTADRTTSATAGAALGALMLARAGVERKRNVAWARDLLAWIETRMLDEDRLVRDGFRAPGFEMMPTKWTYNTGVPIRAYVELYRLTGDRASLAKAKRLGRAAIDRKGKLYDGLVRDPERRFWFDGSYFVHYLADGLLALYGVTKDRALLAEVRRNANYSYAYLRDPADRLYFRNWRLWTIGDAQLRVWEGLTGQKHRLEADDSERSKERRFEGLPVRERPLVKTLLANAGQARLFWLLARAK